jgi:hypothetical protein
MHCFEKEHATFKFILYHIARVDIFIANTLNYMKLSANTLEKFVDLM